MTRHPKHTPELKCPCTTSGQIVGLSSRTRFYHASYVQKSHKSFKASDTNVVYDVTSYVEEHPGGDAILAHAGDDSTEGFYGPQHATRVFDMIGDFYIGDLMKN
ncbi:uncharacterized protein LOC127806879 isoform X2 [Diospyros lotus]|uniref:uncharacterized protein LOC127806879 isoform X2 n=1 Tax=Diospyros lotus TaxID=55363 RepID=UPI0022558664|nr:uncharacterized protein LOC127806879 isoform X2 [Diospyros lotus]XP_052200404.1 uncharacterized protein LOC127806879 isoform X2 [Diospyros lotus]XP_052200405.1 uncharacterized protein LOC127806879 isoform X2 [Diospyros lotus]